MTKNHLKRLNAPQRWNIHRKLTKLIARPNPGGNNKEKSIALSTLLKENLKIAETRKEVKYMLQNKQIFVNGKNRFDEKYPIGFMDVLTIPIMKLSYVITINKYNFLEAIQIKEGEAKQKLSKLMNKKTISTKETQLNFEDGSNLIAKTDKTSSEYKTGDTLVIEFEKNKINNHLKLEKNACVLVHAGKHAGNIYNVKTITDDVLELKNKEEEVTTKKTNVLVIGKDKPIIKLA